MTPDSFFQVNRDLKPGVVPKESDDDAYKVYKPKEPPNSSKDFKELLDKDNESSVKDVSDKAKEIPEEKDQLATKDPTTTKKEKLEQFLDQTTKPDYEVDPRFNQTASMAKDSKVAPKLGKEMTVAPAEEPRAQGYIEPKETKPVEGKVAQELPDAVPHEKVEMKTASGITIEKPENLTAAEAKTYKGQIAETKKADQKADQKPEDIPTAPQASTGEPIAAVLPGQSGDAPVGPVIAEATPSLQGARSPEQMHQLINDIVSQITTIADKAQTDTVIQLNLPGAFQGTTLTVSSFTTAPGEFNLIFENLTQEAKHILDLAANRSLLKEALDQRGYIVHMITTTTTTIERTPAQEAFTPGREGRSDSKGGDLGQEQQKDQDEEQKDR